MRTLRHLTDEELLREFADKRNQSPIIRELCERLEVFSPPPMQHKLGCPVCRAGLDAEYDEATETLTLKAQK